MIICDESKCTGCFACKNICPKGAIEVKVDKYGRTIPKINETLCVECGLCAKTCPVNDNAFFSRIMKCYAAQTKKEENKVICASGGISTGMAEYVIRQGGCVFGSSFDRDLSLEQRMAETSEEIKQFCGSKYVQSYTGESYRQAEDMLKNGKLVLYVGTPCQIDGLRHYLKKNYENLITVDIICHGTPPLKILQEYISDIVKGKEVCNVSFRGKNDYYLSLYDKKGNVIYKKWRDDDYYFLGFSEGYLNRSNCYVCKYAQPERVSDITIGDFWGLNKDTLQAQMKGKISVVLINTKKGIDFWEEVSDQFCYEAREIQEAVIGNPHLSKPIEYTRQIEGFREEYLARGISKALRHTDLPKRMIRLKFRRIKKIIKNMIAR